MEPLYAPPRTFGGLSGPPHTYDAARVVVLPAPYDATTTFRGGTRDGPRAIVDASLQMELYDAELGCEQADAGIHTLPELEPHLAGPEHMVRRVETAVGRLLDDGKLPIMLGGEHTLTAGAVAACAARYPDLAILYLDAHADVREPYLGAEYNHASALRLSLRHLRSQAGEPPPAVAVGIRSLASEEADFIRETRLAVVSADEVVAARYDGRAAVETLWQRALARLGPPGRPLYVSVDLDAFDPSVVAAVGTPEPGGLGWYETLWLLRAACARFHVVMADVVELAPLEGPVAGAFAAAKLVYKLVGYAASPPAGR
ncbi:MAG TPA: agmatinase [Chloroflexota bacterium]|nr:agmatinase [Chloroflexota bacterium]